MNDPKTGRFVKTHGGWVGNKPHFLWSTWIGAKSRCRNQYNKDYAKYGGRGIKFCERWQYFGNFLEDMLPSWKPETSLGRIDNDGPYSPENCRWETPEQQNSNRRDNRLIEYHGLIQTATEWSRSLGINKATFFSRIRKGVPLDNLMDSEIHPRNKPRHAQA